MAITLNGDTGITTPTYGGTVAAEYIAPVTSFKNRIINGAMDIWQRGTTFNLVTGSGIYTADRWQSTISGTSLNLTVSQDTSVPNLGFKYSLKFQQLTSNATSVTGYAARQRFELCNVKDLAANTISISFWYRSNVTGTHGVRIIPLDTTGGVDTPVAFTVNVANTWEYKTITTTALSALTSWGSTADNGLALILDIGIRVNTIGQTTINANDYFNVVGVQLEKGSTATSFDYRPYGTELDLCRRYYQLSGGVGRSLASATMEVLCQFCPPMRATPSSAIIANGTSTAAQLGRPATNINSISAGFIQSTNGSGISVVTADTGLTTGAPAIINPIAIGWSAEL
jgi:hypothetical protein